jgi:hypothetical protein
MHDERFARSTCSNAPNVPFGSVVRSGVTTRARSHGGDDLYAAGGAAS